MLDLPSIGRIVDRLARKYGLWRQFDCSLRDDMIQAVATEIIDAECRGLNVKAAVWRAMHEEIRLVVYGGRGKRTSHLVRVEDAELDRLSNEGLSLEDKVDWWRKAETMTPNSPEYAHYVEDRAFLDIGKSLGVSESRACQKVKGWVRQVRGL